SAPGARDAHGGQGVPRAVGQGALGLGRRRRAPAQLRVRMKGSPRAARPPSTLNAYVLHRYDWSETSLILDLFTREQGRIAVAAKGAKRPYSQLRSVLLPFQRLLVAVGRLKSAGDEETAGEVKNLR